MESVPSKKLGHTNGLSRLILKYCELLEDMVIVAFKEKSEIKEVLVNTVSELLVTEEIKVKSETDNFIKKMKNQMRFKENRTDLTGCNYH